LTKLAGTFFFGWGGGSCLLQEIIVGVI